MVYNLFISDYMTFITEKTNKRDKSYEYYQHDNIISIEIL